MWGCQATREFPGVGPFSVLSSPRGLGISLDPRLSSFCPVLHVGRDRKAQRDEGRNEDPIQALPVLGANVDTSLDKKML